MDVSVAGARIYRWRNERSEFFISVWNVFSENKSREIVDIQEHWAKIAIMNFIENGYIGGYEDNTIRTKYGSTRAEVVSILFKINNMSDKDVGTVLIENNNYTLQKYEPREGTYLGFYEI